MKPRRLSRDGEAAGGGGNGHFGVGRWRRGRVLVVDDEESGRVTTAAILEQEGYEVETAGGGREALERAGRGRFDVVLTDLRMDDMDGVRLLAELRERHTEIVAVLLTGYASIESSVDALRRGAYDYLVKPCGIEEMLHTVGRALEHGRQRARIDELSSPVVEVWDGVLLVPLVGTLDDRRAAQMSAALLASVRRCDARVVIVDVTGCTVVDTYTAGHLVAAARGARLLGAHAIITGVNARMAADLVRLGVDLDELTTRRRLADGLRAAFEIIDAGA